MKNLQFPIPFLALWVFLAAESVSVAQLQTQTFRLNPGWNAIWIEVQPTNTAPASVFARVPLTSLWTFADRSASVEFIQNPNEPMANRSQWLLFVPTNKVESFQNSLFAIQGHRAYLVELGGTAPATLSLTGLPSLRVVPWATDAYTLRGLPIDATRAPSFAAFFAGSTAHFDSALRRLQSVYRLNATGQWALVDADDKITGGEAYWIRSSGASDYPGPLDLQLPVGEVVDFGTTTESITLTLRNRSGTPREVRIDETGDPSRNPLSYAEFNPVRGVEWRPLFTTNATTYRKTLAAGQTFDLRLSVRRTELGAQGYGSALVFSDNFGTRHVVPMQAGRAQATGTAGLQSGGAGSSSSVRRSTLPAAGSSFAGLWFGSATVTNVSEAHSGTLMTNETQGVERISINRAPTPTAQGFSLRLIVHVDTNGTARLLKEVLQMRTLPTYTNRADGIRLETDPGRVVLVTDERLIPTLAGTALRGGQQVARRLSSVDFDFPGAPERNYVDFAGTFDLGRMLRATLVVDPSFPTNPFKHKYHPDHDNLTANFKQFKAESPTIDRTVELTIARAPSGVKEDPAYGYSRVEGQYRETLKGLHREPILISGGFFLRRISDVGVLNR